MTDRTFTAAVLAAIAVMLMVAAIAAFGAQATRDVRIERQADINTVLCQLDPTTCER